MAGDWIKMRADLLTSPKVVRIASALNADRLRVIGALHAVWCLFDVHSEDGSLDGYTPEVLDEMIGWAGFCDAMAAVKWITIEPGFLYIPRFDDHNGQSAKRRAQEALRKQKERADASASDADKKRTREEKRRDKHTHTALAPDWVLPKALGEWAIAEYPHWTPDTVRLIASKFANHFHSTAGESADWSAAWRNWCHDDLTQKAHRPARDVQSAGPKLATAESDADAKTAAYLAEREGHVSTPEAKAAADAKRREVVGKILKPKTESAAA